jgi:type I restriction enzyme S subunit
MFKLKSGKSVMSNESGIYPIYGGNGILGTYGDYNVEGQGVLIGRVGAYAGNVRYIDGKIWISDNALFLYPTENVIYARYLYYYFIKNPLRRHLIGGAQPLITQTIIYDLELVLPDIIVQKKIADKISVYDDKIENNNKIIELLEEKASLLYKRYFVDFEFPNEEGLAYKSNGGEFKESEVGEIPVEWHLAEARDVMDFITGFEPGSKNYVEKKLSDEYVQFFRVKDLNEKQSTYIEKEIIKKNNQVSENDVLVSFDGTIGRVVCGYNGAYSSGLKKVNSNCEFIDNSFVYLYMKSDYTQNMMREHATGTTILHASKSIEYMKICLNESIYLNFLEISNPIYQYIQNTIKENELLKEKRDLLIKELIK